MLRFGIPGVPVEAVLHLEGGVPYVARDEAEARRLERARLEGDVRLIDRFEARHLRARREASGGRR
jgi:hypothetical protein